MFFKVLLAAFFLLASVPVSGDAPRVDKSVRPLYVDGRLYCTTTSIDKNKGYWLTAAHCVRDDYATFRIDGEVATVLMRVMEPIDLAILEGKKGVPDLPLSRVAPSVGDKILIVGHPQGLSQLQHFKGFISSMATYIGDEYHYLMTYDITACKGNSGSAVVNKRDRVVSVLQVGWGKPCSGLVGGATWTNLARFGRKYFRRVV